MPTSAFDVALRHLDSAVVLDLRGDVDADARATLDRAYTSAVEHGTARLLLNFTEVGYINSTGLAVIVGMLARARTDGVSVSGYGLSDHYREIFAITRLSDFMPIWPDEAAAGQAA